MTDGTVVVGLFNRGPSTTDMSMNWDDLKLNGLQMARDLWQQKNLGI